jgi:Protein of unknown function (DUF3489)
MSIKLTDTQLIILSMAAQRDDRCLVASKSLKGGAAQKFAAKLLAAGLVKEIKAKPGMPPWRRDEGAGQSYALKLTAAGLKAIATDEREAETDAAGPEAATVGEAVNALMTSGMKPSSATSSLTSPSAGSLSTKRSPTLSPREGTKLAQVLEFLRRDGGATLAELAAATGWLPHTTRAALTGLRKRGYEVTLDRTNNELGSTYRIGVAEDVAEDNQTLSGDEPASQSNEPLATEAPAASEGRSQASVRSAKREQVERSPKRKAA